MKIKNIKQEKAITLIALVITIIVLLILAGVAISMLSGENGILSRASEAKESTETAQKEEEANLASMELETYFLTNNSKYKCSNGYITGVEVGDKIENLKNELLEGYDITLKYIYYPKDKTGEDVNIEESDTDLITGMSVVKDGKIVARVVIFGDIMNNGKIDGNSLLKYQQYAIGSQPYGEISFIKVAMDINHDGKIDGKDRALLKYLINKEEVTNILQNKYAMKANDIKEDKESILVYANVGINTDIYTLTYNQEKNEIYFEILGNNETSVETLLAVLPENSKIKRNGEVLATAEVIQDGDEVVNIYNEKEYIIGKIKNI